jgi:hypothetical protein
MKGVPSPRRDRSEPTDAERLLIIRFRREGKWWSEIRERFPNISENAMRKVVADSVYKKPDDKVT